MTKDDVLAQSQFALKTGKEDVALDLLAPLAEAGDWRASASIGFIHESRGKFDRKNYVVAAHWYSRALSQGGTSEPNARLAYYHYFGLGGTYDFRRAFDHLLRVDLKDDPEATLMMAELRANGLGTPVDLESARRLFQQLATLNYPIGHIGLARIAKQQHHWKAWFTHGLRGILLGINIIVKDKRDVRLLGLGKNQGHYWRAGIAKRMRNSDESVRK